MACCGLFAPILSDEVFSLNLAGTEWGPMLDQLRADVHPPLYYLMLHLWLKFIPATEAGLRAFSGACLALATALFWRVLRRESEPGFCLSAIALWLANPLVILMAGYGRMYALLAVWCVIALSAAWRICSAPKGWLPTTLLTAVMLAGLLTHNWFIFYLCGLCAMMAWQYRLAALRLIAPLAVGAIPYALLWGGTVLQQSTKSQQQLAWLKKPGWEAPFEALTAHLWLPLLAGPLILVLVAVRKTRDDAPPLVHQAALLGAAVTLVIPLVVSLWRPIFNPRFTIVAAPFLALGLAGVVRRGGSAAAALLLLMGAFWGFWNANHPSECNSRSAAATLSRLSSSSDTVIYTRLSRKPIEWYWRDGVANRLTFPAAIDSHPGYEGAYSEASLRQEARQLAERISGRLFVVADPSRQASRILLEELRARWHERSPHCLSCEGAGKDYFSELILFDLKR